MNSSPHSRARRRISGAAAAQKTRAVAGCTVAVEGDDGGLEMRQACEYLPRVMASRSKYRPADVGDAEGADRRFSFRFEEGVLVFGGPSVAPEKKRVSWVEYYNDVVLLQAAVSHPPSQAASRHRLQVLEEKYNLYKLNSVEMEAQMDRHRRGGGTFADSTKVDNATHLVTSMHALQLLEHIQNTHELHGSDIVRLVGEKREPQTLRRMFEVLDVQDPAQLSVEALGLDSSSDRGRTQHAFLNPEYNRAGRSSAEILRVFLTRNELNNGLFLAQAVRPNLERNEARRRYLQCTESMIDIAAHQTDDWDKTAKWFAQHDLSGFSSNSFFVKVLHETDGKSGLKCDFEFHQAQFENFFTPLALATVSPDDPKYSDLAALLKHVGGFVLTTDEESREAEFSMHARPPNELPWKDQVCEMYFAFYFWANLSVLNATRRRLGLNTFQLRSFIAEGSSYVDIPIYSYLLCDAVHHALILEQQPVLQYLYALAQIGVCMSPLSNNGHAVSYMDNPFPVLFRRGLRVSLSTDHPLIHHHSTDPLVEEYGTASKLYRLSGVDMCEIARNSVLISSFPDQKKQQWLGDRYTEGSSGNEPDLSNIPTARLEMREESLAAERRVIENASLAFHHRHQHGLVALSPPNAITNAISASPPNAQPALVDTNVDFPRIVLQWSSDRDSIHTAVAAQLSQAMGFRSAYVYAFDEADAKAYNESNHRAGKGKGRGIEYAFANTETTANGFVESEWRFKTVDGIVVAHEVHKIPRIPAEMPLYEEFRGHVRRLREICENVHIKAFCRRRLQLLEHRFKLHLAVNHALEAGATESKMSSNRDFYQTTKVDTNVRMETGMTARQLLNFIVAKANNNGDDIVNTSASRNGEPQTLRQLLKELSIDPDHLTVDSLNVQVDTALGVASQQFTPQGRDDLLKLVLKTDNAMKGRYFAELTKMTFDNFKRDKFTFAENRLPVYGASEGEWDALGNWFDTHGMAGQNNQWMVQIPRIYGHLRKAGKITNFAQYLENIFNPLWQVSLRPKENPRLFHFVDHITGFDCVEDERRPDVSLGSDVVIAPQNWTSEEDPPYNYYLYHIWANIYSLNTFRKMRDFSTFTFRPSCGEDGHPDHLLGGFLTADAISYGVTLKDSVAMQYLFYLGQVGIAVSPLSNNTKVLDYLDNPFPQLFRRGLNVSLSTDSPLQIHHTQEPLIEEYSIASKVWKLSPTDMCEIARNSVRQSGFDPQFKRERLGRFYFLSSSRSNDAAKTHLSDIRVAYRWETYHTEMSLLDRLSGSVFHRAMLTPDKEATVLSRDRDETDDKTRVIGGIINVSGDVVDVEKLKGKLSAMEVDIADYTRALANLTGKNKSLRSRLDDEVTRDAQAEQLRRKRKVGRGAGWRVSEQDDGSVITDDDLDYATLDVTTALEGGEGYVFPTTPARAVAAPGSAWAAEPAAAHRRTSRTVLDAPEQFWQVRPAPSSSTPAAVGLSEADRLWQESATALDTITAQMARRRVSNSSPLIPVPPPRR